MLFKKKWLYWSLYWVIFLIAVGVIGWYSIHRFLCSNEIINTVKSPGGSYEAIVYVRNCGATTGFSTQISIVPWWWWFSNTTGNAFIADGNDNLAPVQKNGGIKIQLNWESSDSLVISHDTRARIFLKEETKYGSKIRYDTFRE
jgi:hypothetical protein